MQKIIAIRREDLNKRGEKRVAVTPQLAEEIIAAGHALRVQPRVHPEKGTVKRAFRDEAYEEAGATITEDLSPAKVVFGLKEVSIPHIQPDKVYLCFSHTHKGQVKNRSMLRAFMDRRDTLIDYELVTNADGDRVITAFTYFAGYAGMIDTLWTVGRRLKMEGHAHPFAKVPQSVKGEDLDAIRTLLHDVGGEIAREGTPEGLPPFINVILGEGKTSAGAQEIYGLLPVETIEMADLPRVFREGSRNKVYQCVLGITDMFRHVGDAPAGWDEWSVAQRESHYFAHPEAYESNLDRILPYATILMNCIIWSPEFPRTMSKAFTREHWRKHRTLKAIGDITCDPNGSIEFSKETWIDAPVYIYEPETMGVTDGFRGEGIAVMAVTNLPCEFSADASKQFSADMAHLVPGIVSANYEGDLEESGLPEEVRKAVILWKGELTPDYAYMQEFLPVKKSVT